MSQSAEQLTTSVRALPPAVAGWRSSGGPNVGQDLGLMNPFPRLFYVSVIRRHMTLL
jgi:hypothetical protein